MSWAASRTSWSPSPGAWSHPARPTLCVATFATDRRCGVAVWVLAIRRSAPVHGGASRLTPGSLFAEQPRATAGCATPGCAESKVADLRDARREAVKQCVHHGHHHECQSGGRDDAPKYVAANGALRSAPSPN